MRRVTQSRFRARQRDCFVRPCVHSLEDRLPPGDILLGKIWAASWFGANPPAPAIATAARSSANFPSAMPVRVSASDNHNAPVNIVPHPAADQARSGNTSAPLRQAPATPGGPDDWLDPLTPLDGLPNPSGSHGKAPPSLLVSPPLTLNHATEGGGVAASVGAPLARAAVAPLSQPAAGVVSGSHLADELSYVVASAVPVPVATVSDWQGEDGSGGAGDSTPPSGRVHALFQLDTTQGGPFPADRFTVADHTQNTDRRVNLPYPDCSVYVSDCQDIAVLNTLDGFNLQPRLSVPFDGSIDVNSVSSQDMFLVSLGDTLNHHDHGGQVVGINQVVWDTFTDTLHVESDQLLDQHTRYALIVTNGIHDERGQPVAASREFRHFRQDLDHSHDPVLRFYGNELEDAVRAARHVGVRERDIVDASVFTTESATAIMEKIRDQIHASTPDPADFNLGPDEMSRTVFPVNEVTGMTLHEQTQVDPPGFTDENVDPTAGLNVVPGAVSEIAYGKYVSPDYQVHPGEYIPPVGTRTGTPAVQSMNDVYFTLFLPSGPRPPDGWPVMIFGHGGGAASARARHGQLRFVAAIAAEHGIATIGINSVGYGFGPLSTLTVSRTVGEPITFLAGGRSFDQDHDGHIESPEGDQALAPARFSAARTRGGRMPQTRCSCSASSRSASMFMAMGPVTLIRPGSITPEDRTAGDPPQCSSRSNLTYESERSLSRGERRSGIGGRTGGRQDLGGRERVASSPRACHRS